MEVLSNGMQVKFWIGVEEEPDIDRFIDEQIMIDMDRFMLVGTLLKVNTCKKKNDEKEYEYFKQLTVGICNICSATDNNINISVPTGKEEFLYEIKFRYAPEPEQLDEGDMEQSENPENNFKLDRQCDRDEDADETDPLDYLEAAKIPDFAETPEEEADRLTGDDDDEIEYRAADGRTINNNEVKETPETPEDADNSTETLESEPDNLPDNDDDFHDYMDGMAKKETEQDQETLNGTDEPDNEIDHRKECIDGDVDEEGIDWGD